MALYCLSAGLAFHETADLFSLDLSAENSLDLSTEPSRESSAENSQDISAENSQEFPGLVIVLVTRNTKGVAP